ncbi:ribonuclease D [Phreatobacter aquaticus]|uniref:Ribonuclease D n=1 Tax=Phreatobacter aquaticus TaxID=2570229 RepID=A0A4D7QMF7_9HYPH|nr:ribonuclease D [Phreatobacter aquaticus]QCK87163.1 ribonuclease D [Phreatobacter aquaticus]
MMLITSSSELAAICARLAKHPFVTVDTEFLRETTFWPKLCVIQLASPDEAVAIDALAPDMDLAPFFDLMVDPGIVKVFHAARQDVEIIWHLSKRIPAPLFDSQVAAMVLGYGDSISYDQLVQRTNGTQLDKTSRFTDWSKRPLSEAQIIYAIADVTHLRDVYLKLTGELEKRGRSDWVAEEMRVLTSPETYRQEPERAWERFRTRVRKPRELAVLMEVAAWREREAQMRNVPRSRVLKDDSLIDIAMTGPKTVEALGAMRSIPKGWERSRDGISVVEAAVRGLALDPKTLPAIDKHRPPSQAQSATVELLKVLLKMVAEKHHVAAKVVATSDDLDRIAEDDEADIGALKGWRRELFGEKALALKHGKLALAIERGRVVTIENAMVASLTA